MLDFFTWRVLLTPDAKEQAYTKAVVPGSRVERPSNQFKFNVCVYAFPYYLLSLIIYIYTFWSGFNYGIVVQCGRLDGHIVGIT